MSIINVTPTLSVDDTDLDTFIDINAAVAAIRRGERITVTTLWEAEAVLSNLGMDYESIQTRLLFATTGRLA